jgi:AcrR family transcriptional regulator
MRVTAEAKQATRERILEVARRLFQDEGFDQTTIRDIAAEVGMATGTLFNYFASKEEVAVTLAEGAVEDAARDFKKKRRAGASLTEDLYLQAATQIRQLREFRRFIQPVIETGLSAPVFSGEGRGGPRLAQGHLQLVAEIVRDHRIDPVRWSTTAPIYWALYVGVLTFWGQDKSPKQEDTLAMLDQAMKMFANWVESNA